MNGELATETQVRRLEKYGYTVEPRMTREEAARVLHEHEARLARPAPAPAPAVPEAMLLRQQTEHLRITLAQALPAEEHALREQLTAAQQRRVCFWADTCRDPSLMREASQQTIELYMKQGCRFHEPTHEQIQEVLEALDSATPTWDADHPDLFYKTLELNFSLLRVTA